MDNILSKRWEKRNEEIDTISLKSIDDITKSKVLDKFILFPFESNTNLMKWEVNVMEEYINVKNDFNILEIGSGIGNFCRVFQSKYEVASYTILDTPNMLRFSKFFLDYYKVQYTAVEEHEALLGQNFDLCVSNMCMSELPDEYLDILLKNVLRNCRYVFFIDTMRKEFAEVTAKKLLKYSKFRNVKCIKYDEFYLPNHGVIFASRDKINNL
jgi:putative sugar O-methyltransferase